MGGRKGLRPAQIFQGGGAATKKFDTRTARIGIVDNVTNTHNPSSWT